MWYSSPSTSPQDRVSPNGRVSPKTMAAGVETDLLTGGVALAEFSSEPDFIPNAAPNAQSKAYPGKAKAAAAGAAGPGTEYWLP
jgi:hypothetical protein